jgi:nicotinic acid mononucleotide adenylyltransferase
MSTTASDIAQRLVKSEANKSLVCIAIAGGGSHAIATLAATPGASALLLEGTLTYDRRSFHSYVQYVPASEDNKFKYVSSEAAHLLSKMALARALRYRPKELSQCIGVGSSSALVSKPGRISQGHIVATHADGRQWECLIKLAPEKRTRLEEDQLVSRLILESIEQVHGGVDPVVSDCSDDELKQLYSPGVPAEDSVRLGAERVLRGEVPAVLLLPREDATFCAMPQAVVPDRSLVFPGSFNPPHAGHVALANAAKSVYVNKDEDPMVLFEVSLINADKPALEPTTVSERLHKFFRLGSLPTNWGILLTSAPLFSQKADILRDLIAAGKYVGVLIHRSMDCLTHHFLDARPQMAFVIGTDTMVRILNPKYYGGCKDTMLKAVRDMKGVHFVVGGRLQQEGNGKFVTGEEELADLPKDVQEVFSLVNDFRVDISSTELRKQEASS